MEVKDPVRKNAAKCRVCGDIIESKHRHDWVSCQCGRIFVDGGKDYWHCGETSPGDLIRLNDNLEPM